MLWAFEWAAWNVKNFSSFSTLNPQIEYVNLDEWAKQNEAYYLLYERALRGHARQSNAVVKEWIRSEIIKRGHVKEFPDAV